MERLTYTVREAAKVLGVGMNTAYELVNRPDFPAIRLSERRIVVPVDGLKVWLDQQAGQAVGR